jgi:hypothetical protein
MQRSQTADGPIKVEFATALKILEYDLIIGCDGATLGSRAMSLGCNFRNYIFPKNCWAAYFSIKRDLLLRSRVAQGYSAVGGRFISIGQGPSGSNRIMLTVIYPCSKRDTTLLFRQASIQGDDALKKYIVQQYQGAG